jgi:hypothetical protein
MSRQENTDKAPGVYINEGIWVRPSAKKPDFGVTGPQRVFTVPAPPPPSPAFSTAVTPSSAGEGSTFTASVNTTNVADGTVIPFIVTGSAKLVTTSGNITITGNFGSTPILTQVDPGTNNDVATFTLQGIATGKPSTSANFTITDIPTLYNFEASWRNCSSLTSFTVDTPE